MLVRLLGRGIEGEELLDAVKAMVLHGDGRSGHAAQLQLDPGDQPGEAEAADGRGVEFGVVGRAALAPRAVGAKQFEAPHMAAEGAGDMVVLAVHVVSQCAAKGDEARAGGHRQEPAARQQVADDIVEQHAGLGTQHACRFVEGEVAIEAARLQQLAAGVDADVAVAAAVAPGQHGVARGQRHRAIEKSAAPGRWRVSEIAPGLHQRLRASATAPSATANHSVASRQRMVADTATGSGRPLAISSATITASLPPRPPGRKESPPTSMAKA